MEKVVADRIERKLTYADTSKDMAKWQEIVTENRNTKTLDFDKHKRDKPSYRGLVKSFEPTSELEKDINMVLLQQGGHDGSEQREIDELLGQKMSLKEIKAKQAELAKVKVLMFYEQMKRHRLNKIKSKAYHRIRKRQKQKRGGVTSKDGAVESEEYSGGEGEEGVEDADQEATRRIKERMDLRHQNTGKWARMAKKHSRVDKSLK